MKKILFLIAALLLYISCSYAQYARLFPSNWWIGMKHNTVQVLLYGPDAQFGQQDVRINYPGVELIQKHTFENGKYMALDIQISDQALPGLVTIEFQKSKKKVQWELKERRKGNGTTYAQGVTSSDFIYLLMPDRFSNGDPSNDRVKGMKDQTLNRDSIYHRHGGDLQGVINHLDYLQSLGVTSLWMTPVIENDMPERTEHGYAFTDHYKIEPRIGGEKAYLALSDALHQRGMKLIQDAVYNHIGLSHFLMQDSPAKDWVHQFPEFTQTSFRDQPLFDPYASPFEKKLVADGWFVTQMPDVNHENPYVEKYLIQHAIWSVEMFGVDGWRIDTYIYNNLEFMNRCNTALVQEFPKITMFGEAWVHGVVNQAYFVENNIDLPFKSNLQGAVDFQTLFYGIHPALKEKFGWMEGVSKLYNTLSNDILYKDPMRNVIMLDNHDMTRIFSELKEDVAKQKMAIGWLLTCRGIPQMYYGTEVIMAGVSNPDGWVRLDFPGGWTGDKKNAFTRYGLTPDEKNILSYTQKLGTFRKNSSAIKTGKMMQYIPKDGLYVYFRYDDHQTVMCVMNTADKDMALSMENYPEMKKNYTKAVDIESGTEKPVNNLGTISPGTMWIFELK